MRIIFVENENINRTSSGGIMSYLINMSKSLIKKNYKTVLVGSGFKNVKSEYFSLTYSISNHFIKNNFTFFFKLFFSKFNHLISEEDIFHIQRLEMSLPISFRFSNKIICTVHGSQIKSVNAKKGFFSKLFFSIVHYFSLMVVNKIIFVDIDNFNFYKKNYPWIKHKIELIPISIDTELFYKSNNNSIRKKYNFSTNDKIALYVGRLELEKNVDFIIDCFKEIKDDSYKLVIVGSGSQKEKLIIKSKNYQNIIFLGEINHNEIPKIIKLF